MSHDAFTAQDPQGALGFSAGVKQQPVFTVIYTPSAPTTKPTRGKKTVEASDAVPLKKYLPYTP